MTTSQRQLAHEIRKLADNLLGEGWDRVRGLRLARAATVVIEECKRINWLEAIGRASELVELLGEFAHESPKETRLKPVLQTAAALADLLDAGQHALHKDRGFLPARPQQWLFVLAADVFGGNAKLAENLAALGFPVIRVDNIDEAAEACLTDQAILIAAVSWLSENAERVTELLPATNSSFPACSLLVAIADTDDFHTQAKARQIGARLLLDPFVDVVHLTTELAGLAWMPNPAYRIMVIDNDAAVLRRHANMLQASGFEVLALEDPVSARNLLSDFAAEACVLSMEMPGCCQGSDLAFLLRRDKRYARLPIIFLADSAGIRHQLDARYGGGEDYLIKPVDSHLLLTAVMARARQFRILETAYRQRRHTRQQFDNLRTALDTHALLSVVSVDGAIIDVNRKFCELSGYSREELIGRNHRIVKSGHHSLAFFEGMWTTLSAGRTWCGEIQNRRKDGRPYWVQSSIVPIMDERHQPKQYLSIRTDITAQKRIQAKRQHQARLLDLLRQAFQHYISHYDVEATSTLLLDGILLLTDSAYGFLGEVVQDPDGKPYLKTHALTNVAWDSINRHLYVQGSTADMESRNLDNLVDTVLHTGAMVTANNSSTASKGYPSWEDFTGIPIRHGDTLIGIVGLTNRSDRYDVSPIADFLHPFTDTYAKILEAARQRHFQQRVILDLQQAKDAAECADQNKSNFLANWGLELRTPLNAMLAHSQILQMSDTLETETRQQLAEIAKGGKQLSRLIGDLANYLDSNPVTLTAQNIQTPPVSKTEDHSNSVQRRILVAEDNPANQAVLSMQLGVLGFTADIAGDGAAALLKWQAGGHDLILADRNMPVMDGIELTRAIRATETENAAYVPIIAITAAQHPEELSLCRQAGMDDILPKPIELDDLRNMLQRWLPQASPLASQHHASNPPTGENKTILDTDYLARIIGNADAKQTRELIDLFTSSARNDLYACRQHLSERDGRALYLVMHKLKSSARMVGALSFGHLAENLERAAKANRLDAAATLLTELKHALNDVETAVSQLGVSAAWNTPDTASVTEKILPSCVLVVDDDPVARRQITLLLNSVGIHEVLTVETAEAALVELARANGGIDLLISDLNMPGMDGIEFLRHLAEHSYQGCMIISSGVDERLLQTAAEMARAKGMNLRGILKKPVTRNALIHLLDSPCEITAALSTQREKVIVTPDDIRQGIDRHEFEVHFQPKVDAVTLAVVGMEALARWQHHGNMISPDIFINMAERHGLIGRLSEVLISKALIGGVRLAEAGYALTMAVNLSANWLSDIHLPEFILASVEATGFKAENLILEITETGVMADIATALDVMTRLRLKGFKLSIDDFGTGYSSMEQLQRIPFSELKLDRSFVQGAIEKNAARAILASTIDMAQKMKLTTVAEGVEILAELDLVRGLGCDLVQGWYIAKAMPMEQLLVWLKERNA